MGKKILNDGQRVTIRGMHSKGISIRALASMYGVSRGTIRFVLHPVLEEENRQRNKLRQRELRKKENTDATSSN